LPFDRIEGACYLVRKLIRLVAIGDELLDGHTRDTNTAELIDYLNQHGFQVDEAHVVRDREESLKAEVAELLAESSAVDVVISTGGLGPTVDDRTRQVLAGAFGAELIFDEARWSELLAWFAARGRRPKEVNRSQALHPVPGASLKNEVGTASGLVFEKGNKRWIALPGVPTEMRHIANGPLKDMLSQLAPPPAFSRKLAFRTRRLPEASMHEMLQPLAELEAMGQLGFYPNPDGVLLRVKVEAASEQELVRRTQAVRAFVLPRLGSHLLCEDDLPLVEKVFALLSERCQRLALAESCTGGMLARQLTDLPGASSVFPGGIVAYENEVKAQLLAVSQDTLLEDGAVSEACVRQMALGARKFLKAHWALSISGIAGPNGGTDEKPVGTVWLGVADGAGQTWTRRLNLRGNREQIRLRSAAQAWVFLYESMTGAQ
jgi:nicotinamide-nucleotide amidase